MILKGDGFEVEIGSIGIQRGSAAAEYWAWAIDNVIPCASLRRPAEAPRSARLHARLSRRLGAVCKRPGQRVSGRQAPAPLTRKLVVNGTSLVNLNLCGSNPSKPNTAGTSMAFQVVHKRRGGIATASQTKPVIDLTKTAPKLAKAPPVNSELKLQITAAQDGPPIAAELPERLRTPAPWSAQKSLTGQQVQILDRIIRKAGDGHPNTLGLRLVLAAAEDELAAAWPIGLLSKALRAAGYEKEGFAVYSVAQGCRVARFKDMAATSLTLLNQKLEEAKGPA